MKNRAYEIVKNRGYNGYQKALASMVHKFFDKKKGSGTIVNEHLAEELHNTGTKRFKTRKVYAGFKDNT